MKYLNFKYINFLFLLFTGFFLSACIEEPFLENNYGNGDTIAIQLTARTGETLTEAGTESENNVTSLRMIVYNYTETNGSGTYGRQVTNIYKNIGENDDLQITAKIARADNNIRVFLIANEQSAWRLEDTGMTVAELKSKTLTYSGSPSLNIQSPFVMFAESPTYPTSGNIIQTLSIKRIIAKVSLKLNCIYSNVIGLGAGGSLSINKASVKRIPKVSHLGEDFSCETDNTSDDHADGIEKAFENGDFTIDANGFSTVAGREKVFYMPEHLLTDKNYYTYLILNGKYTLAGGTSIECVYRIPIGDGVQKLYSQTDRKSFEELSSEDLTVSRNVHYKIDATVKSLGEKDGLQIVLKVDDWTTGEEIDGSIKAPYLNVSTIETDVLIINNNVLKARIYYWTNQKEAVVETTGILYTDMTGDQPFTVNNVFKDLAGNGAPNNILTTSQTNTPVTGYIDLDLVNLGAIKESSNLYRVLLNAGGVKREITINVSKQYNNDNIHFGYSPWIGTFHRWNQTGERIISSVHSGKWIAEVVDSLTRGSFVRLSPTRSGDPRIGTDDPGDAERYPVTDGVARIEGNGGIYFRIGLTGKLASPESQPRYARVRVTWGNGGELNMVSHIYVRQGEAADYLMRPGDPGAYITNGTNASVQGSMNRTGKARKFSPYNLSVARPTQGGPFLEDHYLFSTYEKAVFTDYPTKAGWFFCWNMAGANDYYDKALNRFLPGDPNYRRAYHPFNPGFNGSINQYDTIWNYPTAWGDKFIQFRYNEDSDPCPPGYVTPGIEQTVNSLWKNFVPTSDTKASQFGISDSQYMNFIWGYYADGYFDRRPIRTLPKPATYLEYYRERSTAGYGSDVAHIGALYYNPDTTANNSLFLPAAGIRVFSMGLLSAIGGRAYYNLGSQVGGIGASRSVHVLTLGDRFIGVPNPSYSTMHSFEFILSQSSGASEASSTPIRCVKKE